MIAAGNAALQADDAGMAEKCFLEDIRIEDQ